MATLTTEQWLLGMVDYDIPEVTLSTILFNNSVEANTPAMEVALRERELCLADLYMWLATSSVSTSGELESDGGWQHQKANKNVSNRPGLIARAMALYRKWGSEKADEPVTNSIVMGDLY